MRTKAVGKRAAHLAAIAFSFYLGFLTNKLSSEYTVIRKAELENIITGQEEYEALEDMLTDKNDLQFSYKKRGTYVRDIDTQTYFEMDLNDLKRKYKQAKEWVADKVEEVKYKLNM